MSTKPPPTLLCSANFPAGAGYAWDFIESLYAGVADRLAERGVRTFVAYPGMKEPPGPLEGAAAEAIDREFRVGPDGGTSRACALVRELGATVLYMADRPAWHPGYAALRRAGVHSIIVHDHTSGTRSRPRGARRMLKRIRSGLPGTLADRVIAVSDFVARRKIEVDLVPADRVLRVWNSIEVDVEPGTSADAAVAAVRQELAIETARPIVLAACRASKHKGIHHLLRAFDRLERDPERPENRPALVYAGDGPDFADLRSLRERLDYGSDVHLLGYRADVPTLIEAAAVCVVPSVWAEAFGLAALEPMALRRPVVASEVGGLPEVVVDGETGVLVPPGDERALSTALGALLADPGARHRMGEAGRRRVFERFERRAQLDRLAEVIAQQFPTGVLDP
ncbi:MAG: glycosyltransferase family 4 protein [Gemmatimonadota bacterium]